MPSLLESLEGATEEDLAAVRRQIADHLKAADKLKLVEKILDAQINGLKKRVAPQRNTEADGVPPTWTGSSNQDTIKERQGKVAKYLLANGAKSKTKVGEANGIAAGGRCNLGMVLDCEFFHVTPDGMVCLTDKGERFARIN